MAFKLKSQESVKSGGYKMMGSSPKKSALPLQPSLKTTYKEAFDKMKPTKSGTRVDKFGNIYKNTAEGFETFKNAAKAFNAKKNKGAVKPSAQPTKNPVGNIKNTITNVADFGKKMLNNAGITPGNVLGKLGDSITPKAKNEIKTKLKKNKLTGRTKTKTVEKIGDKVIKTKTITDRKGNTKTKTKTRKRTAGKGKQKLAKGLIKVASKLIK